MKLNKLLLALFIVSVLISKNIPLSGLPDEIKVRAAVASVNVFPTPLNRNTDTRNDTTTIWFDDLEGDVSEWTAGTGWNLTTDESSSPTHSFNVDDDNFGLSPKLSSPAIQLPELESSEQLFKFSFDLHCDMPDWDGDGDNSLEDYYRVEVANISDIPIFFHQSTTGAFEGNSWWCADPTIGGYQDGWLQALESPSFTVSGSNPELTFKLLYKLEEYTGAPDVIDDCTVNGWDAANVRISTDGGNTWTIISGSPSYTYSSCFAWFYNDEDCSIPGWGGNSGTGGDWVDASFDLSSYAGQSIKIRFYFGSDYGFSTPDDPAITGLYLDNILASNSSGDTLLFDNADDQVVMTAVSGGAYQWEMVFYDYGDITRPGGNGWVTYMPGYPFDNEPVGDINVELDLTEHAGDQIKLRWTALIDDNYDGGNGSGLYIDDLHIWSVDITESLPVVQNLAAVAGDGNVELTWDNISSDFNGDIVYDDGTFENAINMTEGTSIMGTMFDAPAGIQSITVNNASIYGGGGAGATTLYGYETVGGVPSSTALYSTNITTATDQWTDVTLDWTFNGDFILAVEISPTIGVALDMHGTPSSQSWANLGNWSLWSEAIVGSTLPDGEWGIRANVTSTGGATATYNVYRSTAGGDYILMFNGQELTEPEYTDNLVVNGTEYCYQVTVIMNGQEGAPADPICATPEAQTVYEIVYDDDTSNTSFNVAENNYLAVRFTPTSYPSTLKRLKYYIDGTQSGIAVAQAWDDDGGGGMPGTNLIQDLVVQLAPGWNVKDVSALNMTITEGDFYIGWQETAQTPPIGIDTDSPADRSVVNLLGNWEPFVNYWDGAIMVRAEMDSATVSGISGGTSPNVPETFSLAQNYPNPFNPVTNISFEIPEIVQARLTLYDLTGREIRTLFERTLSPAQYQYQLDAGNLASGMYIYRLEAYSINSDQVFNSARKLILMK